MFFNKCLAPCRTVLFTLTSVVVLVITTDWISWDKLNRGFLPSDEVSRAFLASFILVFDLLIVMQVSVFVFPSSHGSCAALCSQSSKQTLCRERLRKARGGHPSQLLLMGPPLIIFAAILPE